MNPFILASFLSITLRPSMIIGVLSVCFSWPRVSWWYSRCFVTSITASLFSSALFSSVVIG